MNPSATEGGLGWGMFLTASAPSPRTIPERISIEQVSCTLIFEVQFSYMG